MVLLISYDLNRNESAASYDRIAEFIKANAIDFRRPLKSQWFVETAQPPKVWDEWLRSNGHIDDNDRLFICQIRQPYWGWLDREIWPWLSARE